MRLLFLGTGGYHPNERRHTACLMLPELGVVLDAGSSVFRISARMETKELDVFLTHPHLDHVQGMTNFLVPMLKGEITRCRVSRAARYHCRRERTSLFAAALSGVARI